MTTSPIVTLEGVSLMGIQACVPAHAVDSLAYCTALCGDAAKAENIVRTTGIRARRTLVDGRTALDLSVQAAQTLLRESHVPTADIGAVLYVTFTPDRSMPCNACQAQARLGLDAATVAFDIGLACSGWLYGVYVAGLLAKSLGRKVLLLDGDTQTPHVDESDLATASLLADAGTATLIAPSASSDPLFFAFRSDGEKGAALQLPPGGKIAMDGFAVFKFVTVDVLGFIQAFLSARRASPADFAAFVPHQANVYMIRQISRRLGFAPEQLKVSGDALGNSSSASVPVTIARAETRGRVLAAGFGGGLSAAVGEVALGKDCLLGFCEV